MPKGLPSISSRTRLTMMLGEVPTSVISPPSSAANDIGIRKTEGGVLFFFAIWSAEVISIASAPTFLTSADAKPTEAVSTTSWVLTRLTRRETRACALSITPARSPAHRSTHDTQDGVEEEK